ncbi:hypothetical protein SM204186_06888 [Salmonella enterica subsp. enterica serovar Typhi]|nr:hypothetical protein SM204186_06888 [Salmonella enterica subsp. enterica serovar Typhi]
MCIHLNLMIFTKIIRGFIRAQLRQVLREKRMREGEGYTTDKNLLASQLLAFCEGMLSRFVRSEFKYRPTDDFDARWPLIAAQLQ